MPNFEIEIARTTGRHLPKHSQAPRLRNTTYHKKSVPRDIGHTSTYATASFPSYDRTIEVQRSLQAQAFNPPPPIDFYDGANNFSSSASIATSSGMERFRDTFPLSSPAQPTSVHTKSRPVTATTSSKIKHRKHIKSDTDDLESLPPTPAELKSELERALRNRKTKNAVLEDIDRRIYKAKKELKELSQSDFGTVEVEAPGMFQPYLDTKAKRRMTDIDISYRNNISLSEAHDVNQAKIDARGRAGDSYQGQPVNTNYNSSLQNRRGFFRTW